RKYDVVDWGAMQFLKISQTTRRRLLIEELLLMAVRMALLAVFVLALAGPFLDVPMPASLAGRPRRDVVLIIDGSARTGASAEGTSPAKKATAWAQRYLDRMQQGDNVSVLLAREQAVPVTGALSADVERARRKIGELPEPAGTCNWAESLRSAFALLAEGQNREREVYLLSDNQRFGVADEQALFRWELLASELGLTRPEQQTKVRFVDLTGERPASLPNYAMAALESNRPIAAVGREVRFKGALVLSGQEKYSPPYKIRLEVDGKHVRD